MEPRNRVGDYLRSEAVDGARSVERTNDHVQRRADVHARRIGDVDPRRAVRGHSGPGGSVSYGYDSRGNQTSAGTSSYGYNLADRLTAATANGTTTGYSYDGDGNRLAATGAGSTISYLWDVNNPLPQLALERDGPGATIRSYIRGLDTIAVSEGGNSFYYHHDRLDSVTALTSASGQAEWTYSYEPFGAAKTTTKNDPSAPDNPLQYVGQYIDTGSGLYDLRARQYDPAAGVFTSLDPTPASPTGPYETPYNYAGENPINGADLSGQCVTVLPVPCVWWQVAEPWLAVPILFGAGYWTAAELSSAGPPSAHTVSLGPTTTSPAPTAPRPTIVFSKNADERRLIGRIGTEEGIQKSDIPAFRRFLHREKKKTTGGRDYNEDEIRQKAGEFLDGH